MIRKQVFPNAWYSDGSLNLDSAYLEVVGSAINLNSASISVPGENILFLAFTRYQGVAYLSGQGNATGRCWIWSALSGWISPCFTFGVNPVAFDTHGNLFIVSGSNQYQLYNLTTGILSAPVAMQLGSQGIRYIDWQTGQPISADSTYSSPTYGLGNYYDLHVLQYGQSYVDGVTCVYKGARYQIEPGNDQIVIHAYTDGTNVLFVSVHQSSNQAVFTWCVLDDITSFPPEPKPVPPEPTPIPPEPTPIPPTPPKSDYYHLEVYNGR